MLQYLSSLKNVLKGNWLTTEGFVFFLNYRVTSLALLTACIVVTSNLFVGEPIACTQARDLPRNVIDSYCWVQSTYSIESAYGKKVGFDVPHPGVDANADQSHFIYRDYYQWVCFVLFIQAVFFYVPHLMWKGMEKGSFDELMRHFQDEDKKDNDEPTHQAALRSGTSYFSKRWGLYDDYTACYVFCELLCMVNVLGQFFLLDLFFQGEFKDLGFKTANYLLSSRLVDDSPLSRIFPRVTVCHFNTFGSSGGTIDTADVLCILTINAINERIFLLLWVWLFVLCIVTSVRFLTLLLQVCSKTVRLRMLNISMKSSSIYKSLEIRSLLVTLCENGDFGDWFLLSCISYRMDVVDLKDVLEHLQEKLEINSDDTNTGMLSEEEQPPVSPF